MLSESGLDARGADLDTDPEERLSKGFTKVNAGPAAALGQWIVWRSFFKGRYRAFRESFFISARDIPHSGTRDLLVLTKPNITALCSQMRFFSSGFFGRDSRPLNEVSRHPLHHFGLATFPELWYELHISGFRLIEVRQRHAKIKPASYPYAIYAPWMWCYTCVTFLKEKDAAQRTRSREILATLHSPSVLFKECLILIARRIQRVRHGKRGSKKGEAPGGSFSFRTALHTSSIFAQVF